MERIGLFRCIKWVVFFEREYKTEVEIACFAYSWSSELENEALIPGNKISIFYFWE